MRSQFIFKLFIFSFLLFFSTAGNAQELSNEKINSLIDEFKTLHRGPYLKIEWFCDDGTKRDSKDPCPDEIGGIQHASYKPIVERLQEENHIFFADILAYTNKGDFWDANNQHSRLKQYQLNQYLMNIDNGWIMEKAQFYRGAIQSEDEEEWGINFYNWLLLDNQKIEENFFLIRQSLKNIPHSGSDQTAQKIRNLSKVIADNNSRFMDVRTKLHSQPEESDLKLVKNFREKNSDKLSKTELQQLDSLQKSLQKFYAPIDLKWFAQKATVFPKDSYLRNKLENFSANATNRENNSILIENAANLMCDIRTQLTEVQSTSDQLVALDISLKLEEIIFRTAPKWKPENLREQLDKIYALSLASASAGFVEWWEWNSVDQYLQLQQTDEISLENLQQKLTIARSQVEWSASMVKAIYGDVVEKYEAFEPKTSSFIDDRLRSSIALQLGKSVSELGDFIAEKASLENNAFKLDNQSSIRGLNPGYALGELEIISGTSTEIDVNPNKIYIFQKPPSDLKPVAGILTVAEGNLVSHVQLLARNLGIPNAVISAENLKELQKYEGEKIFFAVSEKGTVVMKEADDMENEEEDLFASEEKQKEKINVPTEKIDLTCQVPIPLSQVDATDSGKVCGPKAANLGQLKMMFPEKVVNGVVVPFGVFRQHMNQKMPLQEGSYWDYLKATFAQATQMRKNDIPEEEVELCQLDRLFQLQTAIKNMPLQEDFKTYLAESFYDNFNQSIGNVPVFLRSDTNMEDLPNFTGAGLNLTVFNVRDENKIIQGIKDVWASPYTERSFKWRQRFLENPENVYPSILIIPSVDVDYSGVMITKGISNDNENDLTLAFSRGAGGAVDGQSAETWLIDIEKGAQLLSPAREASYNRLPTEGGLIKKYSSFNKPILSEKNINAIRKMAKDIRKILPERTSKENTGPYDVELGFQNNKLWLFQIRPFVENKNAKSSTYLKSITPTIDNEQLISLETNL